jgi:hypothetical protein
VQRNTFCVKADTLLALSNVLSRTGGIGATVTDETDPKMKANSNGKVDLAQLGFAERRTTPARGKPGDVGFDALGNALYQWKDDRMLEEGEEASSRRQRALSIANLVLVDDEPPPDIKTITANKKGLRVGYNPYDSGRLKKEAWKKPRDLRALSQWIEAQKRAGAKEPESDDEK